MFNLLSFSQSQDSTLLKLKQFELGNLQSFFPRKTKTPFFGCSAELMPHLNKKEKFIRVGYFRSTSGDYFSRYRRFQNPNGSAEIIHTLTLGGTLNIMNKNSFIALRIGGDLFYHYFEYSYGRRNFNSLLDIRQMYGVNWNMMIELFSNKAFSFGIEISHAMGFGKEYFQQYYGSQLNVLYESDFNFYLTQIRPLSFNIKYNL